MSILLFVNLKGGVAKTTNGEIDRAMPDATASLPILPDDRPLRLTPTDVSQFVRLEQCERFLRFRLAERAGQKFMEPYDVTPQRITPAAVPVGPRRSRRASRSDLGRPVPHRPLRRRSTARPTTGPTTTRRSSPRPASCRRARPSSCSSPGWRPRLDGWLLRGDVDLLRLERHGRRHPARPDRRHEDHRRGQGRTPPPGRLLPPHAGAAVPGRDGVAHAPGPDRHPLPPAGRPDARGGGRGRSRSGRPPRPVFGLDDALLEVVADPDAYLQSAHDLVLGPDSTARRVARAPFERSAVLPVVQVRRLPVQRVLHEVERRARRPVAAART